MTDSTTGDLERRVARAIYVESKTGAWPWDEMAEGERGPWVAKAKAALKAHAEWLEERNMAQDDMNDRLRNHGLPVPKEGEESRRADNPIVNIEKTVALREAEMKEAETAEPMSVEDQAELERANKGRAFWKPFCLAGWQLMGWTDDVTATFVNGEGHCLEMRPGHVEIIRQVEQAARADERRQVNEDWIVWLNDLGFETAERGLGAMLEMSEARAKATRALSTEST